MTEDSILDRLAAIARRYDDLSTQLADPAVFSDGQLLSRYGREQAELQPVVTAYRELKDLDEDIELYTAFLGLLEVTNVELCAGLTDCPCW
jgi:peptide chain release factor 1